MKMFPHLATVVLFTILIQPSWSCLPFLTNCMINMFQSEKNKIIYKTYTKCENIPFTKISKSGKGQDILVGEFYEHQDGPIGEVGLPTDNAMCEKLETPKPWPAYFLPSVRYYDEPKTIGDARGKPPLNEEEFANKFIFNKKEIWKCEIQKQDPGTIQNSVPTFNMVVNQFQNNLPHLIVRGVGRLSGVSVEKREGRYAVNNEKYSAKITEVKYFVEGSKLVKYEGKRTMKKLESSGKPKEKNKDCVKPPAETHPPPPPGYPVI